MSNAKVARATLMLRRNLAPGTIGWWYVLSYLNDTQRALCSIRRFDRSSCIATMSRSDVTGEGLGTKYGRW